MTVTPSPAKLLPLFVCTVLVLGACTGGDDSTDSPAPSGSPQDPAGRIIDSGFVQDAEFVQTMTLVESTASNAGQDVTLTSKFFDSDGEKVGSESLSTAFNYPGQTIAIVGGATVKNRMIKVASVESELRIDEADNVVTETDLGTVEGKKLRKDSGGWTADFTIANPGKEPLVGPDVGVVCRDEAGEINGGGLDFVDVPAGGETVLRPFLIVDGKPAECTAYVSDPT